MPSPYDNLPDLRGDYETPQDKLKRQLDELAGLLGQNWSWKGGIQYDNGDLRANLSNRGLRMQYPFGGGLLGFDVTDIGTGDPHYQLRFRKTFK